LLVKKPYIIPFYSDDATSLTTFISVTYAAYFNVFLAKCETRV
jgi:hypothetical protein